METRRLILAIVLIFAVVVLYNYFFVPKPEPGPKEPTQTRAKEVGPASESPSTLEQYLEREMTGKQAKSRLRPVVKEKRPSEVVVDSDLFRVVFSTDGGGIKSLRLRRYKDLPPNFITAKEKLLAKNTAAEALNEFQLANAKKVLGEVVSDFRSDFMGQRELSSEQKDRLKELAEQFLGAASRISFSDLAKRRASAGRLRTSLSKELSYERSDKGETMRLIELLEGVEMVPPYLSAIGEYMLKTVYPLGSEEKGRPSFETVQFTTTAPASTVLASGSDPWVIRFEADFNDGKLIKEYRIRPDSYMMDLSYTFEASSSATVAGQSFETWLGPDVGSSGVEPKGRYSSGGIVASDREHLLKDAFGLNDMLSWAALQDRYFIVALARKTSWLVGSEPFLQGFNVRWVIPLSGRSTSSVTVFAGPKDTDELEKVHVGLEKIIDFGWLTIVAEPIYVLLKYIYKLVGNYGLAIIILALLIKIVFYPLTVKQTKSMKKMQVVAPQIKALREKYKNDKERLNKEIMTLYKTHEVNPMGGCLPMLIQFPVLFALIRVLPIVIDLRQAPFILWLHDLSEPDPYYITPILMGVAMLVQQKMTPAGDPKQAKMMMMMSVVFTFFFLSFSSGLVLYWLTGTVLQVAQQVWTSKKEQKAKAPAS
ncbi:MAG TPA: membrane protein insertase YidC [bacterium]|nr:membrane protein insertase YidC [bacterium]